MSELDRTDILLHAEMLCSRLNLSANGNNAVIWIGDDTARTNLAAVMTWVSNQTGLQHLKRITTQEELHDRLCEHLSSRTETLVD